MGFPYYKFFVFNSLKFNFKSGRGIPRHDPRGRAHGVLVRALVRRGGGERAGGGVLRPGRKARAQAGPGNNLKLI